MGGTIDRSPGFNELREAFPRRFQHHPNLMLLTDEALKSSSDFREAMSPSQPPNEAKPSSKGGGLTLRLPANGLRGQRMTMMSIGQPVRKNRVGFRREQS